MSESTLRLQYGITLAVPVTALRELLREQGTLLRRRGYRPVGL